MEKEFDPIKEQYLRIQSSLKQETQKKRVDFDVKNYLNVKLTGKESEKTLNIRLFNLNTEKKTPFEEVYMHYYSKEKRSFVCAKKTKNVPEGTECNCPFCDIRENAAKAQIGSNPEEYEKLKKIFKENGATLNYVVRVIDRDDEEFGVKFWKISQATYESILSIYRLHKKANIDIFDTQKGRDLIITIKKSDGKSKIANISASLSESKLAETKEKVEAIINDTKVWSDVYGVKPYDYLYILINGGTPFYDKSLSKWVPKKEEGNDSETDDDGYSDYYANDENDSGNEAHNSVNNDDDELPF